MSYLPWLAGGAALGYAARRGRRATQDVVLAMPASLPCIGGQYPVDGWAALRCPYVLRADWRTVLADAPAPRQWLRLLAHWIAQGEATNELLLEGMLRRSGDARRRLAVSELLTEATQVVPGVQYTAKGSGWPTFSDGHHSLVWEAWMAECMGIEGDEGPRSTGSERVCLRRTYWLDANYAPGEFLTAAVAEERGRSRRGGTSPILRVWVPGCIPKSEYKLGSFALYRGRHRD